MHNIIPLYVRQYDSAAILIVYLPISEDWTILDNYAQTRCVKFRTRGYRGLNLYFMTILTAKSPVLSTGGNDNSKSRYGNDLKFVMAFLDRCSSEWVRL